MILRVEAKSLMQRGDPESKVRFEQAAGLAASAAVAHAAGRLSLATVLGSGARRLGHDDARSGIDQTRITGLLAGITMDAAQPERHVLLAALANLSSLELERR